MPIKLSRIRWREDFIRYDTLFSPCAISGKENALHGDVFDRYRQVQLFGAKNVGWPQLTNLQQPGMISSEHDAFIARIGAKMWVEDKERKSDLFGMFEATTQTQLCIACRPFATMTPRECAMEPSGLLSWWHTFDDAIPVPRRQNVSMLFTSFSSFVDEMLSCPGRKFLRFFIAGTVTEGS